MSEIKAITRNRNKSRCKHFNGIMNDTCDAGIAYADVRKDREPKGTGYALPCLADEGATCEKCQFPTAEEVEAAKKLMHERIENMGKARAAIVAHLGGPWKKGMLGARGAIDCPACGKPGALHFTRAGYNGHIHAACETPGCCSWME